MSLPFEVPRPMSGEQAQLRGLQQELELTKRKLAVSEDRSRIASYPPEIGVRAIQSGRMFMSLQDGQVSFQSGNPEPMSSSLNALNAEKFRSAFIFCDQPTMIKIDGQPGIPLTMGMHQLKLDMYQSLELNSYLPQCISVILSTGNVPPVMPLTGGFDFRRFAAVAATSTSFTLAKLKPINTNWSRSSSSDGTPFYNAVLAATPNTGEEGPVTSMLNEKMFMIDNIGSFDAAVKIQGMLTEGGNWVDLGITGPQGTEIPTGESSTFHIGKHYFRVRINYRMITSATTLAISFLGKFGAGGGN